MKVLFAGRYNESEILNGPEKAAKRIFNEYSVEDKTVFAEYFFDGRKHSYFKKLFGFENVLKNGDSYVLRFGIFKFLLFLIKTKPTVIHIITYERFAVVCFLYKIFCKVRIIYNVHGLITFENKKLKKTDTLYAFKDRICENIFFKYSDKLIFLSVGSADMAKKYMDFSFEKIVIIPNGIDEIFYLTGRIKKTNYTSALNIVFAGDEGRKEKGLDFLMKAVSTVKFRLNIFVIGKYNKEIYIDNANIEIRVTDRMNTTDFSSFLSDKDVFISASYYEQFSITAAESMAAGLATIATAETGMSSYIENELNGFVINYNDTIMLSKYISMINSDRTLLENISKKSVNIYNELSWKTVSGKYKTLYN